MQKSDNMPLHCKGHQLHWTLMTPQTETKSSVSDNIL